MYKMNKSAEIPIPTQEEQQEANKLVEPKTFARRNKIPLRLRMMTGVLGIGLMSQALSVACGASRGDRDDYNQNVPVSTETSGTTPPTASPEISESSPNQETTHSQKFAKIREKIQNSQDIESTKTHALETINRTETIYNNISKLVEAYEAEQTDGKPTLLVQTRQMYKDLDLTPLWQGEYASEEDFLKDQVFFLKHQRILEETLTTVAQGNLAGSQQIEEAFTKSLIEMGISDAYLNLNSEKSQGWQFAPNVPQEIIDALSQTQTIGTTQVIIDASIQGGKFDAFPPTIRLNEHPTAGTALHEKEHAQDIYANPNNLKFIDPKKAVRIMIARNNAVLETRNWDEWEKIYSETSLNANNKSQALTEEEVNSKISFSADRMLVNPTSDRGAALSEPIFKPYIKSPKMDEVIANVDMNTLYKTTDDFLNSQSQNLDTIAAENPLLGLTITAIRQHPQSFQAYFGREPFGRTASQYFKVMSDEFSPIILSSKMLSNSQDITGILSDGQKLDITQKLFTLIPHMSEEQVAEGAFRAQTAGDTQPFVKYINEINN